MTKAEREERMEKIRDNIFSIEIGSDYLSDAQRIRLSALYAELSELKKEAAADEPNN